MFLIVANKKMWNIYRQNII